MSEDLKGAVEDFRARMIPVKQIKTSDAYALIKQFEALTQERDALQHDIEQYIKIASDEAAKTAEIERERDRFREALQAIAKSEMPHNRPARELRAFISNIKSKALAALESKP